MKALTCNRDGCGFFQNNFDFTYKVKGNVVSLNPSSLVLAFVVCRTEQMFEHEKQQMATETNHFIFCKYQVLTRLDISLPVDNHRASG